MGFNGRPLSKAKQSGAYKATITVKNIYLAADAPERQPAEWTCRPNEHCKFAMLDVCSFVPTVLQTTALKYAVLHAQLGCLPAVSDPCETWHQRSGRRERVLPQQDAHGAPSSEIGKLIRMSKSCRKAVHQTLLHYRIRSHALSSSSLRIRRRRCKVSKGRDDSCCT